MTKRERRKLMQRIKQGDHPLLKRKLRFKEEAPSGKRRHYGHR